MKAQKQHIKSSRTPSPLLKDEEHQEVTLFISAITDEVFMYRLSHDSRDLHSNTEKEILFAHYRDSFHITIWTAKNQ